VVELMQHQKDAISKLDNGKILYGGVGSGKSLAVIGYYMEKEAPRDIYVITTAKKRDSLEWEREAVRYGISTVTDYTRSDTGTLYVDSWNNISKYTEVEDAFFVFDEQRLVGSGAWVKSFQKIAKRNRWVLLSATPGDTWLDYVPVFIANGLYKNPTEFKREHVIYETWSRYPKIRRFVNETLLEKYRNMLLVEMPYIMHTNRNIEEITVAHDAKLFHKVVKERWNPFTNKPIQDVAELFHTMRKVVNSDPSRLETIRGLMKSHPRIIIFYNFDYELEILRSLGGNGFTIAEWNGHKHQPIPETEKWIYLVQYVAGAEGWNCIDTDTMVFYSLTYSYKNLQQAMGRIDRLNTSFTELYYYILLSNSVIDRAVRMAQHRKKLFNERSWAKEIGLESGDERGNWGYLEAA